MLDNNNPKNEPIEIVKRIEGPSIEENSIAKETDILHEHNDNYPDPIENSSDKNGSIKKIIFIVLTFISLSLIGLFSLKLFQTEKTSSTETNIKTTIPPEKEKVVTYIEELALPQNTMETKENNNSEKEEKSDLEAITQKEILPNAVIIQPKETQELLIEEVPIKKLPEKNKIEVKVKKEIVVKKTIHTVSIHYEPIKLKIITVKNGDSLASLAKKFYNDEMDFKKIIHANRRLRSSKTALRLGEKIIIPRKDNKKRRRFIIVQKGDTLAFIAKKIYGNTNRISTIVHANYRIKSARSTLRLGQKIYIPRLKVN